MQTLSRSLSMLAKLITVVLGFALGTITASFTIRLIQTLLQNDLMIALAFLVLGGLGLKLGWQLRNQPDQRGLNVLRAMTVERILGEMFVLVLAMWLFVNGVMSLVGLVL